MENKQTTINHFIKTLAEQLRIMDQAGEVVIDGIRGASKEKAEACRVASKTVIQLDKLGVRYDTAYDKADAINKAIAN